MSERTKRLKGLVAVQARIQSLHEARHAALLAQAHAAEREAEEIGRRSYESASLSSLFPELYSRKVGEALERRDRLRAEATGEARLAAAAGARADKLGEAYREARSAEERTLGERDRLELVEQRIAAARGRA